MIVYLASIDVLVVSMEIRALVVEVVIDWEIQVIVFVNLVFMI